MERLPERTNLRDQVYDILKKRLIFRQIDSGKKINEEELAKSLGVSRTSANIFKNIYQEGELHQEATHKKFLSVRQEGARQVQWSLDFYNLDSQSAPICAIRG